MGSVRSLGCVLLVASQVWGKYYDEMGTYDQVGVPWPWEEDAPQVKHSAVHGQPAVTRRVRTNETQPLSEGPPRASRADSDGTAAQPANYTCASLIGAVIFAVLLLCVCAIFVYKRKRRGGKLIGRISLRPTGADTSRR